MPSGNTASGTRRPPRTRGINCTLLHDCIVSIERAVGWVRDAAASWCHWLGSPRTMRVATSRGYMASQLPEVPNGMEPLIGIMKFLGRVVISRVFLAK